MDNLRAPQHFPKRLEVASLISELMTERRVSPGPKAVQITDAFLQAGLRPRVDATLGFLRSDAERLQRPYHQLSALWADALSNYLDGKLEEVLACYERIRRRAEEFELQTFAAAMAGIMPGLAWLHLHKLDQLIALSPTPGTTRGASRLRDMLEGPVELARQVFEEDYSGRISGDPENDESPEFIDVAMMEAANRLHHEGAARYLLRRYESTLMVTSGCMYVFGAASIARLLGDASSIIGLSAQARDYYERSIHECEEMRLRPELALSHLSLAELLLDHYQDEHDTAIYHLDFAIGEFREMKMQPALERALGRRGLLKA